MKFRIIFLISLISVFFVVAQTEQVFSQQVNTCQPHTICIHPRDVLKYSTTVGVINSSETYNFGDMIDSSHIKVVGQSQTGSNEPQNYTIILNLKTGFAHSQQDPNNTSPFLQILATPITYNKTDVSITQIVTDFNGLKRTALVTFHSTENNTSKMVFDVETGILLEVKSTSIITVSNTPELVDFTSKLTDTNMINSDSLGILTAKNVISIPSWVKNNAKYWHDGSIDDSTFAQGIQYMIKQGIITIPPTQSGQAKPGVTIPAWVKNNAGYWSTGDIDDATFVKGVQYLITSGIIQV